MFRGGYTFKSAYAIEKSSVQQSTSNNTTPPPRQGEAQIFACSRRFNRNIKSLHHHLHIRSVATEASLSYAPPFFVPQCFPHFLLGTIHWVQAPSTPSSSEHSCTQSQPASRIQKPQPRCLHIPRNFAASSSIYELDEWCVDPCFLLASYPCVYHSTSCALMFNIQM